MRCSAALKTTSLHVIRRTRGVRDGDLALAKECAHYGDGLVGRRIAYIRGSQVSTLGGDDRLHPSMVFERMN